MEVVEFEIEFTDEEALDALRLPIDALEEMLPLITATRKTARPKAAYARQQIQLLDEQSLLIGGVQTRSRVLCTNLQKSDFGVSYVCTCGRELDDLARSHKDPMDGYLQDALNEMVLHKAIALLAELVSERFHLSPIYAMAPGSLPDWPIGAQADLFQTLDDVQGGIGVHLTENYLMLPIKSVSGIFFTGEEAYTSCMLCPREMCPNRRAPYDPALYATRFSGAEAQ